MTPEIICDYRSQIGEGPIWHPMEKRIYWVDIPVGKVLRYNEGMKKHETCYEGDEEVHGLTIQKDGSLLLFMQRGAVANWKDGRITFVIDEIPDLRGIGLNDMIADPVGRVFWGSIPSNLFSGERLCALYRIDTDGSTEMVADDIGVSNGLGFSPDSRLLYYTDTFMHRIYVFDYDQKSGTLKNRRVFVEINEEDGDPDGMTVDGEGYVWTAQWGSNAVVRYNPQGVEERRISFAAKKVSSVCFGGEEYRDMYVTSAIAGPRGEDDNEAAGALFRIETSIRGVPEFYSRIGM